MAAHQAKMGMGLADSTETYEKILVNLFYLSCWNHLWQNKKLPKSRVQLEEIPYEKHTETYILVEVPGIEPGSFGIKTGLLRA